MGDSLYLREYEIQFLAAHPGATNEEIIEAVGPKVRSDFHSGAQLINENLQSWESFRKNLATKTRRQKAEVANLTHFPTTDKKRIPAQGESLMACSEHEAAARLARLAHQLERQVREHGDCREINPELAATSLMRETFQEIRPALATEGNILDAVLKVYGVERDRVPLNPRREDVGYEAIFVAQMGVHARRLLKNKADLLRLVRKERVPSWFVWQELDGRVKQFPNAEIGNVNDKHIAGFGLYVDMLNVDKRIADLLRQASRSHGLLLQVYKRVPKKGGLSGLLVALRDLTSSCLKSRGLRMLPLRDLPLLVSHGKPIWLRRSMRSLLMLCSLLARL